MSIVRAIKKASLKRHVGQYIQIRQADGKIVRGKLVAVDDERVYIKPLKKGKSKGKPVTSNWIIGLFLIGIVFVGLLFFAAWGGGWGGGGYNRGCYKPCCGAPCHHRCGCRSRYYGRRRGAYYA